MRSELKLKIEILTHIFQDSMPMKTLSVLNAISINVGEIFGANFSGFIIRLDADNRMFEYLSHESIKQVRQADYSTIGKIYFFSFEDYFRFKDRPFKEPSEYLKDVLFNSKSESEAIRKPENQLEIEESELSAEIELLFEYLTNYGQFNLNENEIKEECRFLAYVKSKIDQMIQADQYRYTDTSTTIENAPLYDYEDRNNYKANIEELDRYQAQIIANRELKSTPFFGRMDLHHLESDSLDSYYIGRDTIMGDRRPLVYDWRSDIGGHFYLKNETQISYKESNYSLELRRSYLIKEGLLKGAFNEYIRPANIQKTIEENNSPLSKEPSSSQDLQISHEIKAVPEVHALQSDTQIQEITTLKELSSLQETITDPFLLAVVRQKRNVNRLTDIISTIQQQQNEIIRQPLKANLVIQGCAGSGKTMIMLHRLSFLLYKNRDVKPEQICIITPSNFLGAELLPLATELKLDRINVLTIENYLISRLQDYSIDQTVLKEIIRTNNIEPETELLNDFINYLYSTEYINRLKLEYQTFIDQYYDFWHKSKSTIESIFQKLRIELKDLGQTDRGRFQYLFHLTTLAFSVLIDNIRIIDRQLELNERLQNPNRNNSKIKMLKQQFRQIEMQFRLPNPRDIKSLLVDIDESQQSKSFLGLFKTKSPIMSETFIQALQVITQFADLSKEELSLLNAFSDYGARLPKSIDFLVADFLVKHLKKIHDEFGVRWSNQTYRFKLYTILMTLGLFNGRPNKSLTLMCIDEGQQYPPALLKALRAMNPQAAFNIYGDKDQALAQDIVLDDWSETMRIISADLFELRQNYRNTSNICMFTSDNLKIPMIPIGLDGKNVQFIQDNLDFIIQILNQFSGEQCRKVIIVKDSFEQKLISDQLMHQKIMHHVVQSDSDQFDLSNLLIMKIDQVRGLEFEKVITVDSKMTRFEKYVAYTRALNELYIYRYDDNKQVS
jgi:DNA helicase IV